MSIFIQVGLGYYSPLQLEVTSVTTKARFSKHKLLSHPDICQLRPSFAFEARLQSDSTSYQMILKLLTGSWLKDTAWNKCQEHPSRCGDIERQLPQGLAFCNKSRILLKIDSGYPMDAKVTVCTLADIGISLLFYIYGLVSIFKNGWKRRKEREKRGEEGERERERGREYPVPGDILEDVPCNTPK